MILHQGQTTVGYEGVPNDIASIVSYLVSKEAHFITGELRVDQLGLFNTSCYIGQSVSALALNWNLVKPVDFLETGFCRWRTLLHLGCSWSHSLRRYEGQQIFKILELSSMGCLKVNRIAI